MRTLTARMSWVDALPAELRVELDRRLVDNGFRGYRDLTVWLAEEGHQISRTSVYNHGRKLARRIEQVRVATEHARLLLAALPDESEAIAEAAVRMAQERIFDLLVTAESNDPTQIAIAARAVAETARAETALRAARGPARPAAGEPGAEPGGAPRLGISPETEAAIRAEFENPDEEP